MPPKFKSSTARVERAMTHLAALKSEFEAIFANDAISTVCRYDKDSGWSIASIVLSSATIERIEKNVLALELGEYAYQLRAALDGLIWDAITLRQGTEPSADTNRIEFPIVDGIKKKFKDCTFLKFPFPDKLRVWLESIQPDQAEKPEGHPDRGLSAALGDIHDLARLDRHRRLRVMAAVPTDLKFRVISDPPSRIIAKERIYTCDVFCGQYEFLRFQVEAERVPEKAALETHLTFEILLEDMPPIDGMSVFLQLQIFAEAVGYIVDRFEEEFP